MAVDGAVVRIYVQNFMTYKEVELRPGPNLNLVLGPNGSGKSSLVCALCLGLAGKTASIVRGKQVCSFIRHEAAKAIIEIELVNTQGENHVIRREITRDNKSTWKLNGCTVSSKQAEEFVLKLHIQVDNLCQFLPQDRVQDFARMDSKQLLEGTQKAVGEPELWESYQKLIQLQSEEVALANKLKRDEETSVQERQTNQRLQSEVDNFVERQDNLKKIEQLQQRKAWLQYYDKRNDYKTTRNNRKVVEKNLKEEMSRTKPLQDAFNQAREEVTKAQDLTTKKANAITTAQGFLAQQRENCRKAREDIEAMDGEVQARARLEKKRLDDLKEAQTSLANLEKDLLEAKETNLGDVRARLLELDRQISSESSGRNLLASEKLATEENLSRCNNAYQALLSELKALQDVDSKRMEILRRCNGHAYTATEWLRQNRHKFKKPVYEPMIVCLNVEDPRMARYVENRISFNDLCAFGCEDKEDMALLIHELREEQRLKINVLYTPDRPDRYEPEVPLTMLESYGFLTYMKQICSAPHPMMMYLCQNYNLHNIPIGTEQVCGNVMTVKANFPRMSLFYAGNSRYSVTRSRYSSSVGVRDDVVHEANKLVIYMNPDEIYHKQKKKRDLEEKRELLQREVDELTARTAEVAKNIEALRQRKQDLMKERDRQRQIEARISTARDRIRNLESQALNLEEEEAKLKAKTTALALKLLESLGKEAKACGLLQEAHTSRALARRFFEIAKSRATQAEIALQNGRANLGGLQEELDHRKRNEEQARDEAERALYEARRKSKLKGDEDLPPALEHELSRLPSSIEKVDQLIAEYRARADMMIDIDEGVIQDYEQRKKNIERLEAGLSEMRAKLDEKRENMKFERTKWLRPLEDLIGRINVNFSKFFDRLGCAGEIKLSRGSHETDYQNYGIEVYVKYRETESLSKLDAHRQSGGERAVATALYMLALQELTQVPFRCVDEINQGMDPANERKVFDLLMETACHENSAQYFLFTPKLLPNLDYSPRMHVLIVHNGEVPAGAQFNIRNITKKRTQSSGDLFMNGH